MTTLFLAEDVAKDEGLARLLPDGRVISYPDPLSPFAKASRLPLSKRPRGWQTLSPEPWTIGYGTTGPDVNRSTVWTQPQAYARLLIKLGDAQRDLTNRLPWWKALNDPRQDVLAMMVYQMGLGNLLEFKQALAAIQLQDWPIAAAEMLDSDWARETPNRAMRLAKQMHDGVRIPA